MYFDPDEILAKLNAERSPVPAKAPEADAEQIRRDRLSQAVAALRGSIAVIKEGIATGNLSAAAEAWFELSAEEQESIWIAPTRNEGGKRVKNECAPFSTEERSVIKSPEFRKAHYGEDA